MRKWLTWVEVSFWQVRFVYMALLATDQAVIWVTIVAKPVVRPLEEYFVQSRRVLLPFVSFGPLSWFVFSQWLLLLFKKLISGITNTAQGADTCNA